MEYTDDEVWLKAVKSNDASAIETILKNTAVAERSKLINKPYLPCHDLPTTKAKYTRLQMCRCLVIAMVFKARDVTASLLKYGADVTVKETGGNNIIHVMVLLCDLCPDMELFLLEYYRWFISIISEEDRLRLLLDENEEDLRPLESAAQKGHLQLVKTIFETKDVYLVNDEETGVFTVQTFDISDYEGTVAPRYDKSPLAFITFMSEDTISRHSSTEIFSWMPFQQWYYLKLASSAPLVAVWILIRFFLLLAYYALMYSYDPFAVQNVNASTPNDGKTEYCEYSGKLPISFEVQNKLYIYIAVNSLLIIITDIWEVAYMYRRKRPYAMYKNAFRFDTVVAIYFYRVCQHLLVWVFAVSTLIALINPEDPILDKGVVPTVNISAACGSFACILYFLQLAPAISPYVLTIHKMLKDLFVFMILFLLCLLPLAYYFLVFFSDNTKEGCVEEFSTFWSSMYSSFLIMLNMIDLQQYDVYNKSILLVAHVCFVFIIAILLLNFLIAIMSTSASVVAETKTMVQRLARLHVFFLVEFRTRWFLSRYYGYVTRKRGLVRKRWVTLTNIELTVNSCQ